MNDGSNNNVSSSLSVAISSSRNDSSNITTDHQRTWVDQKVPYSIRGKLFRINIIASHADLWCADNHQNEMLREIHSDKNSCNTYEEDDSEVVILEENKQSFLEEHSKPETLIKQVFENCSVPIREIVLKFA